MFAAVVQDLPALASLTPAWVQLWNRSPLATPFQHPAWLVTWWKHFGSGNLQVVCVHDDDRLVGMLPLFLHEWNGRQQLTIAGSGLSDYLDPLIETDACIDLWSDYLQSDKRWEVCNWQDLSIDTPLQRIRPSDLAAYEITEDTPCTAVSLPDSFDRFWSARSSELRRNQRRYGQRANAVRPVSFHVVQTAQPDLADELIRLHGLRWQLRGEAGVIVTNHAEGFFRDVIEAFAAAGSLRLFVLRFGSDVAAMVFGFVCHGRFYSYMSAMDPQWSEYGFGRYILFEAFQHVISEGLTSFDFLRGDEPYKVMWGAVSKPRCRLLLLRHSRNTLVCTA